MMNNEDLERIMNFIIERQERASVQIERLIESQDKMIEQQGNHEERIARFERSYTTIAQLLNKHDDQLDAVTAGLNNVTEGLNAVTANLSNVTDRLAKLTTLVTSYITARGNGSDGGA
jgi:chromosome segregation ATPase